ncbi:MAG: class I SAM-dependent methyltransferase [Deltaproteobacteria bacterium]|nr:MAG: class I SAM-dependent methyltransferase [Deltaproteobacteria bacterium]
MAGLYKKLRNFLAHPVESVRVMLGLPVEGTAAGRWEDVSNLRENWDERTIRIAGMIPPGAAVIEFGAGRLVLRDHLPAGCSYQPSDIADRGAGTIVCDLNQGFPALPGHYTHAVFSGVLEYIADIGGLVDSLKPHADTIIASYATIDRMPDLIKRKRRGWINHLSGEQFVAIFLERGFELSDSSEWKNQTIYVFRSAGRA